MRRYDSAMAQVFPWVVVADGDTIRRFAGRLVEAPNPGYPASGSSFAVTSILPTADWQLWLSETSHRRLQELGFKDEYLRLVRRAPRDLSHIPI